LASLINSINPIAIIVMAMLILKEKATLHKIIAVIITILGAAVIIGHIQGGSALLGALLSVASVLLWSVSSVLIRFVSSKYDTLTITLFGMSVAICCSFVVSAFQIARAGTTWSVITPGFVASILYLGSVCTFMAMFLWNKSLSMVDAATCSLFYPVQPLVSTLLGVALLGESITSNFILGGILIAGGILYAVMMDSKTADVKITGQVRERDAQEKP
jgi:drug/metabolite transporter (DMT)-like permease